MKIAVMQPYLFPYYGYFQLIHAVDTFVVFDDVNYINRGWINRNNILLNGKPHLFTFPLKNASQNKLINEIDMAPLSANFMATIRHAYSRAPYYADVCGLLEAVWTPEPCKCHRFLTHALRLVCAFIGMDRVFLLSSEIPKDASLRGQGKIMAVCRQLGATTYINPPGGMKLYDKAAFDAEGIELRFVQPDVIEYKQFGAAFIANLSILDLLMFNGREEARRLLERYSLVCNT